jgi:hypothetical protein
MNTNKKIFLFSLTLLSPILVTEKTFAAAAASNSQMTQEQEAALDQLASALVPTKMASIGLNGKDFMHGANKSRIALPYLEKCLKLGLTAQQIGDYIWHGIGVNGKTQISGKMFESMLTSLELIKAMIASGYKPSDKDMKELTYEIQINSRTVKLFPGEKHKEKRANHLAWAKNLQKTLDFLTTAPASALGRPFDAVVKELKEKHNQQPKVSQE